MGKQSGVGVRGRVLLFPGVQTEAHQEQSLQPAGKAAKLRTHQVVVEMCADAMMCRERLRTLDEAAEAAELQTVVYLLHEVAEALEAKILDLRRARRERNRVDDQSKG